METIHDRLTEFISYVNLNTATFELKCGLSRGFVRRTANNITSRSAKLIKATFPNLNLLWLTTGEGDMVTGSEDAYIRKEGVRERLVEFIQSVGISQRAFEERCGLGTGVVTRVNERVREDTLSHIHKEFPELNLLWLLSGSGEMVRREAKATPVMRGRVVHLVSKYEIRNFIAHIDDASFSGNLPSVVDMLPNANDGEYICFEIPDDSMECQSLCAIRCGDVAVCRRLPHDDFPISSVRVILTDKGFFIGEVSDTNGDEVTLHRYNSQYSDLMIRRGDFLRSYSIKSLQRVYWK